MVSDTHSYSDLIFGILQLLGISYRPALADLPDQKGWRINAEADYGPLNTFARGKIDLARVRRHWGDILRVIASIYTGKVRAYDVVTMLQRDEYPTALGEALAAYGRIFRSLHILAYIDADEAYRRDIKHIRNLQEGRHDLAAPSATARRASCSTATNEGSKISSACSLSGGVRACQGRAVTGAVRPWPRGIR